MTSKTGLVLLFVATLTSSAAGAGCASEPAQDDESVLTSEDALSCKKQCADAEDLKACKKDCKAGRKACRQQCKESFPDCVGNKSCESREEFKACKKACKSGGGEEVPTLLWYTTCGDPSCGEEDPSGDTGPEGASDSRACGADETDGASCSEEGTLCNAGLDCGVELICSTVDPKLAGCPIPEEDVVQVTR